MPIFNYKKHKERLMKAFMEDEKEVGESYEDSLKKIKKREIKSTDDVFQEWIVYQDWIKWKDPSSVRKAFILFGDYLLGRKEEYDKENKK